MRHNMRAERARKGYTVNQAAQKVGVATNTYFRWEHGLSVPSAVSVVALSKLYGVTAEYLLDESHTSN